MVLSLSTLSWLNGLLAYSPSLYACVLRGVALRPAGTDMWHCHGHRRSCYTQHGFAARSDAAKKQQKTCKLRSVMTAANNALQAQRSQARKKMEGLGDSGRNRFWSGTWLLVQLPQSLHFAQQLLRHHTLNTQALQELLCFRVILKLCKLKLHFISGGEQVLQRILMTQQSLLCQLCSHHLSTRASDVTSNRIMKLR